MPKPPTMMLRIDRFIASAISLVRMPPDAPTSAPAMISAQFPMTKPAIATAVPVNAFSSEITTGMSAPPIGITIDTPKISAATMTMTSSTMLGEAIRYAPAPTATTASSMFTIRAPGNVTGAELITPCSFPAAMIDPENVTAPMITSSSVVTDVVADTADPARM